MKGGKLWLGLVFGLLTLNVVAVAVLIVVSSGDPSHVVVSDYYQKGLAWDQHMEQQKRNMQLGWQVELTLKPQASAGQCLVELHLSDREARPIDGATLRLEALHKARAAQVLRSRPSFDRRGRYITTLPMRRVGLWEFQLDVQWQGQRYTQVLERELYADSAATATARHVVWP